MARHPDTEPLLAPARVEERSRLFRPRFSPRVGELPRQLALEALVVQVRLDRRVGLARVEERARDVGAGEGTGVDRKGPEEATRGESFQVLLERVAGGEELGGLGEGSARARRERERAQHEPCQSEPHGGASYRRADSGSNRSGRPGIKPGGLRGIKPGGRRGISRGRAPDTECGRIATRV